MTNEQKSADNFKSQISVIEDSFKNGLLTQEEKERLEGEIELCQECEREHKESMSCTEAGAIRLNV